MTKHYQKTIKCPQCNTSNTVKAVLFDNGTIAYDNPLDRIKCKNCGTKIDFPDFMDKVSK